MDLIRPISYCFRYKRRFLSQIANFSHPGVFNAPAEGVSLELGIVAWGQN